MIRLILGPFLPYIAGALLALTVAGSGTLWWQARTINSLKSDVLHLEGRVNACNARLMFNLRDRERDNEIDNIPDDGLRGVPDHWLFPDGAD